MTEKQWDYIEKKNGMICLRTLEGKIKPITDHGERIAIYIVDDNGKRKYVCCVDGDIYAIGRILKATYNEYSKTVEIDIYIGCRSLDGVERW
jgi:hypothetical protein